MTKYDVAIVGGGIAGRTAAMFTARAGLDTAVFDTDESILRRNAHLENFPGFPAGVNPRLLLDLQREQTERAGSDWFERKVVDVDQHPDGGFVLQPADEDNWAYRCDRLVAATAGQLDYLDELPVDTYTEDGSRFVDATAAGRTSVDGLYAAGRLAGKPLQAVVSAGHGGEVAVAVLEDAEVPFAFDWSVPEGYFTDRGHDVPPGVEEVSEETRLERERRSIELMRESFADAHPEDPDPHPELRTDD
ncbi:FAD-dependent oxidoreductase (plasmid) [Halobacterium sp. NMX12-1]|uniref:FAD-dependent oxidoreductase n=1 Tax=Halobacterium sp. NMX12-1 TaxID=3166650 RepID=A0AAU8C8L8_9EURY